MIYLKTLAFVFLVFNQFMFSQPVEISKIEPPNWWAGMKYDSLQLMVYGKNLKNVQVKSNSGDIKIVRIHYAESNSYCFVDLHINQKAKAGEYKLTFSRDGKSDEIIFPVKERKSLKENYKGFNSSDVIYLIVPDRFANGNNSNDSSAALKDRFPSSSPIGRHGGDIEGIISRLDYIRELGATSIWINPLVENNASVSYHGYAATDLYHIDPRYGSNELYRKLADEMHSRGLKLILDHVNNHIGIRHPWVKDLPFHDWLNGTPSDHHNTPHANRAIYDINSDDLIRDSSITGWFVNDMPDLNQRNPFMAKYLIQNTLWWIESFGIDGIREDTYPYPDQKFLSLWAKVIMDEYPEFNIVGEVWMGPPAFRAPYQRGSKFKKDFDTNLPALMDFGIQEASRKVFAENKNMNEVYETIAQDNLFSDPENLVTFLDNHDIERFIFSANGNITQLKLALTLLLTTRGIPQLLYGTEIGLLGGADHGALRANFPGGFAGSEHNAFTKEGRTQSENDIFDFTKKLIQLRKANLALSSGKLIHYPPVDEMYFYFRTSGDEKFLVVINNNEKPQSLNLRNFGYHLAGIKNMEDQITGKNIVVSEKLEVEGKTAYILKLSK